MLNAADADEGQQVALGALQHLPSACSSEDVLAACLCCQQAACTSAAACTAPDQPPSAAAAPFVGTVLRVQMLLGPHAGAQQSEAQVRLA